MEKKKLTIEDLQKKFATMLTEQGSLLCTEDGQAFYNDAKGKAFAESHAVTAKCKVLEVKAPKAEAKAPKKEKSSPKKSK